ncbi:hypothetical protein BDZ89DRAFT_1164460 [Hymenopellis radicata]|nr:hypothetical protein BDZ89DRAFT_1164460 [Hymenopellis radicata]
MRSVRLLSRMGPHPINDTPDDILREIFVYACSDWTEIRTAEHSTLQRLRQSPWWISQVSRSWRAIAVTTSDMWSTIIIDLRGYILKSKLRTVFDGKALRLQLYRCRTRHLSVLLRCPWNMNTTFPVLFSTVRRWKRLVLDIPLKTHVTLASDPACSLDILEEIWLENCLPPDLHEQTVTISMGGLLKTAKNLHTAHVEASLWNAGTILPLFQLKTLSTYGTLRPTFLVDMRTAQNLERLLLCFHSGDGMAWKGLPAAFRICFPSTTLLRLHQDTEGPDECIADVHSHMVFPELQHLKLYFDATFRLPGTQWREDGGGCRQLTIGGYAIDYRRPSEAEALVTFLSDTALVEDLCLEDSFIPTLLISKLTVPMNPGAAPFLPRLRHLDCRVSPATTKPFLGWSSRASSRTGHSDRYVLLRHWSWRRRWLRVGGTRVPRKSVWWLVAHSL